MPKIIKKPRPYNLALMWCKIVEWYLNENYIKAIGKLFENNQRQSLALDKANFIVHSR